MWRDRVAWMTSASTWRLYLRPTPIRPPFFPLLKYKVWRKYTMDAFAEGDKGRCRNLDS